MTAGATYRCAMCGESAGGGAPYGGFKVPPRCVDLMQNSDGVDTDAIAGPVRVDLCQEDAAIAKRMVTDYGTTPLPECDADAVRFDTRRDVERLAAMSGHDGAAADLVRDDLEGRLLTDAIATVKAARDGRDEYLLDSDVLEAKVVVLSMRELGAIA